MAMQLTQLAEQLVTIRYNLDPKHGDFPDADELEATRLALNQLSEVARAFIMTQGDRVFKGILRPIGTKSEELQVEMKEYLQRIRAAPPLWEDEAVTLGAISAVSDKMSEKTAEMYSYLTEWETLWAEYQRFAMELDGAWEQLVHEADQTYNQV